MKTPITKRENSTKDKIKLLSVDIQRRIKGGYLYGEELDSTNIDSGIVAAYYAGRYDELKARMSWDEVRAAEIPFIPLHPSRREPR